MLKMYKPSQPEEADPASVCQMSPEEGKIQFDYEGNKIHFVSLGCPPQPGRQRGDVWHPP